jgi:ubiquinol-cytochrome c reductase iron-sulfur subunit
MTRLWRALVGVLLWRSGALRPRPGDRERARQVLLEPDVDPREREVGAPDWAEKLVAALLVACGLCGIAFLVLYIVHPVTELLGLVGGGALAFLAAALMLASEKVVPRETHVEPREQLEHEEEVEEVAELIRDNAVEGVSRRRLIAGAAGVAGCGLAAAAVTPIASLGPSVDNRITLTPWRKGRRVVDERGEPIRPEDLAVGTLAVGFPEGARRSELGSPVTLVRYDPTWGRPARPELAVENVMAFSRICTHAGCAVSMFRAPTFQGNAPSAALVCPCHYSTFSIFKDGAVIFGPAGRRLPIVPLGLNDDGELIATGDMLGHPGPSWWGSPGPHAIGGEQQQ